MPSSKRKRRQRERLLLRQQGLCYYCGDACDPRSDRSAPTIDHKRAKANGGTGAMRNKVAACRRCNNMKGPLDDAEFFMALLEGGWGAVARARKKREAEVNRANGTGAKGHMMGRCGMAVFLDGTPDRGTMTPR